MHTTYSIETNRAQHAFDRRTDHRTYIAITALGTTEDMHKFFASIKTLDAKNIVTAEKMGIKIYAKVGTLLPTAIKSTHSSRMVQLAGAIDSGERDCPFATMLFKIKVKNPKLIAHIFCFPIQPICPITYNPAEAEYQASILCEKKFKITPTNKGAHYSERAKGNKRKNTMKFNSNPFE